MVGLPAIYRQVLILHDLEQRSTEETARSLESSISAVKTRLHRARRMLSKALVQPNEHRLTCGQSGAFSNNEYVEN